MNKSLLTLLIIAILATVMYFISGFSGSSQNNTIACTQEALICPDGSAVGRTGPNCEFAPCPTIVKKIDPGKFCGGIAGIKCPDGYVCQQTAMYPDAGGNCVKIEDTQPKTQ